MNAISSSMNAAFAAPMPASAAQGPASAPAAAGVAATNGSSIQAIGASYVTGAGATLAKLDEGIQRRTREVEQLQLHDPAGASDKQSQLDMLQRLRDRIQLSMERVGDIVAGRDRDDIGQPEPSLDAGAVDTAPKPGRDEQVDLLEQRRLLLAPTFTSEPAAPDPSLVAGAYAAGNGAA